MTTQFHAYLQNAGIRPERGYKPRSDGRAAEYEQCCFCGEPATCWPAYPAPGFTGQLALPETITFAMCGTCFEECEELKDKKWRPAKHHAPSLRGEP